MVTASPSVHSASPADAPAASSTARPGIGYLPALDGLRAVAVLAVLIYHAQPSWLRGGYFGVEMFFVISGYLITSLLLAEHSQTGRIDLPAFWWRRARRLFPALWLVLVCVLAYALVFLPEEVAGLRGDFWSTVGYVNNWYQIYSHRSYFEDVGRPSLLRHMWSLAVEEQFYLVWPFLVVVLLRRWSTRAILVVAGTGAVTSILAMAIGYRPHVDPSRLYYGTDTRAAGLLVGALLAVLWAPGARNRKALMSSATLEWLGWGAVVLLGTALALVHEFHPLLYRGGFAVVAVATAELVAVAVHPGTQDQRLSRALAWGPLRWIGQRSYGIYLWHFPVFSLTRAQVDVPLDGPVLVAIRLGITLTLAAMSYRWVEQPVRLGGLEAAWRTLQTAAGSIRQRLILQWAFAGVTGLLLVGTLVTGLSRARKPLPPAYLMPGKDGAQVDPSQASHVPTPGPGPGSTPGTAVDPLWNLTLAVPTNLPLSQAQTQTPSIAGSSGAGVAGAATRQGGVREPAFVWTGEGVTGIGDSVLEGVAGELHRLFGTNVLVNADQGRLPWHTPAIVRAMHERGQIHPLVILHLGNNGYFSPEVFEEIMAELKDARRVVVVNVRAPRRWESLNNAMLARAVKTHPQAVLLDWHEASAGLPRIFWKDGIHLRPEGARVYADLVIGAIRHP